MVHCGPLCTKYHQPCCAHLELLNTWILYIYSSSDSGDRRTRAVIQSYNLGGGRLRRVGISYLVLSADQQHVPGLILAPAVSWVSPAKTMDWLVTAIHNIRHRSLSSVWLIIILNLNPGTTFLQPRPFRHHKLLVSKSKYGQELRWDMFSKMTIRHAMQSYFYWTSSNITISRSVDLEFV